MRRLPRAAWALAFSSWLLALQPPPKPQDRKDLLVLEKEPPQVREFPRELPMVVAADLRRLIFFQSPLSSQGLLSEQTSDAVEAVLRQAGRAAVVKLRAFVAGTGDIRRVRAIVTEKFTARRLPLPALTVVLTGALPGPGVQVLIEAIAVSPREENPQGVALVHVRAARREGYPMPAAPMLKQALEEWRRVAQSAGLQARDVLRVTCFVSSLEDYGEQRRLMGAEFPKAPQSLVQPLRAPTYPAASCEIIARVRQPGPEPTQKIPAIGVEQRELQGAEGVVIRRPKIYLTGSQIGFGLRQEDIRLAYLRLDRSLRESGSVLSRAAWLTLYPLTDRIGEMAVRVSTEFWREDWQPVISVVPCEDLPALDATFAVEGLILAD